MEILLYLQNHSRPELMFAVSQCARYTYCSKLSHEKVLKRIGRYLKGTRTKGLIMKPNKDLNIDCFVCGTTLSPTEFRDEIRSRYGLAVLNIETHCDGCGVNLHNHMHYHVKWVV